MKPDGKERRRFVKQLVGFFTALAGVFSPLITGIRVVWAKAKKIILPKGTRMDTLVGKHPANLDTRNLEITPLEEFETMGLDDYTVDMTRWRLKIDGKVQQPTELTYSQITSMPPIIKDVLLICPGFFAYHAHWKGISVANLLDSAQVKSEVTHVSFTGHQGRTEKTDRFPLEDIRSGKVFLAYNVNGKVLPEKHGFPLRLVAEDYYGGVWVKYVYKVTAEGS